MWWKLLLLTLYLVALFLLSRILETVAYYEGRYLPSRILDPVSLSVKRLKLLLDQRGVSYAGVVEKKELTELIENSGDASEGEVEAAALEEKTSVTTNFTGGIHFYEEVEDTKDCVWVVQVTGHQRKAFMRDEDWTQLTQRFGKFGVRTGIFNCDLDYRLCERKKWYTSRLILAVPKGFRPKDKVLLRSYMGSSRTQPVFDWVNTNLASRIKTINTTEEAESWFSFSGLQREAKLRMILFSQMSISPMLLSVLSVKFTGRVKFGTVNTNTKEGKIIAKKLKIKKFPKYLVITPEGNHTFGECSGEYLNYKSMAMFFRSLHPEVNDLFLLSLILINVICWLEGFIAQGSILKRLGSLLWHIGKWNFLLILLWLPILGLFQLPYMDQVLHYCLQLLRVLSMTCLSCKLRYDWLWYLSLNCTFLVSTFLIFAAAVGVFHYLYLFGRPTDNNNNQSNWWNIQWDSYMSAFFRPMATITRPMGQQDMDLEVGMEMLIERLAVPNFWLRPMISSDYIKELPVWKYTGVVIDSDIGSDIECTSIQSGDEDCRSDAESVCSAASSDGSSRHRPFMFICESCRALQNLDSDVGKSDEELEQERLESESACAKFVMDGDYKCMCGQEHGTLRRVSNPRYRDRMGGSSSSSNKHQNRSVRRVVGGGAGRAGGTGSGGQARRGSMSAAEEVLLQWKEEEAEDADNEEEEDKTQYEIPPGIIPSTDCSICLESYRWGAFLCGLPCGHSFHQHCIMGWMTRDNHCCPVCRWPAYKAKPCSLHSHIE